MYDQTGAGPEALGWDTAQWAAYIAFVNATVRHAAGDLEQRPVPVRAAGRRGRRRPAVQPGVPPHLEQSRTAASTGSPACTCKSDDINKTDRFIGENFLGSVIPGGNNPLSTLSGENRWVNDGKIENYAGFAQIGFKFTDTLKLSVGARYTHDKKEGNVSGFVVATGDRFNPNDPRPNVTIEGLCRTPTGGTSSARRPAGMPGAQPVDLLRRHRVPDGLLGGVERSRRRRRPSSGRPATTLFLYATVAEGFKGGGFDDTPANVAQAITPFDPEKRDELRDRLQGGHARPPHAPERRRVLHGLQGSAGHADQRGLLCATSPTTRRAPRSRASRRSSVRARPRSCASSLAGLVCRRNVRGLHRVGDQPVDRASASTVRATGCSARRRRS